MNKAVEIFCGTGGVGKTTLATARAWQLAQQQQKVLLITIDPSRRLKQILQLDDARAGELSSPQTPELKNDYLSCLLMNPTHTFARLARQLGKDDIAQNEILATLASPQGGMNEILAVLELHHYFQSGDFATIVLDTPPGKHFVDFLKASENINQFFDQSFVDIFRFLGKKIDSPKNGHFAKSILQSVVSSGVKKLLTYLEKVTGKEFIQQFIEAIALIYQAKSEFIEALKLQKSLSDPGLSHWFLIASVEHGKIDEMGHLQQAMARYLHRDTFLCVNKCMGEELAKWTPQASSLDWQLKDTYMGHERQLLEKGAQEFGRVLSFQEILSESPLDHVMSLSRQWKQKDLS